MKRIIALILILNVSACAELQQVVNQFPQGSLGNDKLPQDYDKLSTLALTNK